MHDPDVARLERWHAKRAGNGKPSSVREAMRSLDFRLGEVIDLAARSEKLRVVYRGRRGDSLLAAVENTEEQTNG